MGANTFIETAIGPDAKTAFNNAVDQAKWEHGHGGYSGTLAEKHDFEQFPLPALPPGVSPDKLADVCLDGEETFFATGKRDHTAQGLKWVVEPTPVPPEMVPVIRRMTKAVNDKWGPAALIDITDTSEGAVTLQQDLDLRSQTGMFVDGVRQGPPPTSDGLRVFLIFGWASS